VSALVGAFVLVLGVAYYRDMVYVSDLRLHDTRAVLAGAAVVRPDGPRGSRS